MPENRVRVAEVLGALCLATDLGMGQPFGHGLDSTVVAMRLADMLGVDRATAVQTYYGCLLFYAGCTADADVQAELFPGGLTEDWTAVMFASQRQSMAGVFRALGAGDGGRVRRGVRAAAKFPRAGRGYERHTAALCEVAEMLAVGVGLPASVSSLFRLLTERWDGGGPLGRAAGVELPLAIRLVHVARDATFQALLHGPARAVEVVRARAGGAFDPDVTGALSVAMLEQPAGWSAAMDAEPRPHRMLQGAQIDEVTEVRRAALVHDLGKVGVPFRVWHRDGVWSADDWEQIRMHPYYTERILSGSACTAALAEVAGCHHERLDGSGYHRGTSAAGLAPAARLLAAADAYRSSLDTRPGRAAPDAGEAADELRVAARRWTLDPEAVAAVLEAAGHRPERIARRDGLTPREEQTLALLAQGMATKQIGGSLGVTGKTADHYVQQVYAKIGVTTRAAAAVYAMQHGLASPTTRGFSR